MRNAPKKKTKKKNNNNMVLSNVKKNMLILKIFRKTNRPLGIRIQYFQLTNALHTSAFKHCTISNTYNNKENSTLNFVREPGSLEQCSRIRLIQ